MPVKRSTRLSAVAIIAGACILVIASPAIAAPWTSQVIAGGTTWGIRSDEASIGHTYDLGGLNTVSHAFGGLHVDAWNAWCDETTAVVSVDVPTGDTIITCDAQETDTIDLFVTPEYRIYASGDLARMFFTIENRAVVDATVIDFYLYDRYDENGKYLSSTGDSTGALIATDTWSVVSGLSGSTVAGSAWALTGNTSTDSSASDIANNYEAYHDFVGKTFAAASTTYVADFVTIHLPVEPWAAADTDVAFAAGVAAASEFNSFSGRLVAGLATDITVLNWGPTTPAVVVPAVDPALPATGTDTSTLLFGGIGALVMLLGGIGLIRVRSRRVA